MGAGVWDRWEHQQDWRAELERKATHKALNIEEPMRDINSQSGVPGWVIPATALIAAATWFGSQYLDRDQADPDPPKTKTITESIKVDMQVDPPQ